MKPVATLVAITLLALAGLFGTGPVAGAAAEPSAAGQRAADGPLRLDLTDMSPRVVAAGGPRDLVVAGTITNTGDVPVHDLLIRVQRGDPLQSEGALRDALDGTARTDAITPQFMPLPGELAPGEQMPVRLTLPLRGAPETSLALESTGVHELLVNVNGSPGDGPRARLDAARVLLPVLSLPPDPEAPDEVPQATTGGATPFAMLVPITDVPRRLATVPGEPTLLTDDELATSFTPEGRLGGVVGALARNAPEGSRVREATCLAIDPDLVQTAALMSSSDGYQVLGPDGAPVPGAGGAAAAQWLQQLASVARTGCVVALPFADADLVALTRAGLTDLAERAITEGRQVLQEILQAPVVPDVTWPVEGAVDEATLALAARAGGRSLLLSADAVEQRRATGDAGVLPIAGGQRTQFAVLTDPLLTRAAAGLPDAPGGDLGAMRRSSASSASPAGTSSPLSTQDLIGALAFRTQDPEDIAERASGPLVLAPPHQWIAGGAATEALLGAVDQLLDVGRIVPQALDDLLAVGPPTGTAALPITYPLHVGAREVTGPAIDRVRATSAAIEDLATAAVPNSEVGVSPEEAFTPLRRGLLRPVSAAWRARPEAAEAAAEELADRVAALRGSIRVLEPPGPYSLGTSDAPLLITVANGLPVTVRVNVDILPSSGLRVAPIEPQEVPPLGRRQVRVSAQVTRSGQFSVQATVRTPGGELLGQPSRLRVRSTAYGTITVWLTASAGILLVVLAGRRIVRRIRGEPPNGRPGSAPPPSPPDRPTDPRAPHAGEAFPDPNAVTDRLPAVPPPGHRRPPGPPRVPSP
ncbi:MAG TPA: DUF6049 family protein [Pseudonocardia sp.]|uniref:DUF6049 family protein n=1 Tax=Pseudonocardia sp. TaxID=60912 RepID=UPI002B4ACB5F|nr:DUF6049 family protein [Pseudonocardia sp.]HLU57180.1 DUF6049 family protein [Pseudonocardia sp.]